MQSGNLLPVRFMLLMRAQLTAFLLPLCSWAYFRLYTFPFFLIDSALFGFHTLCADSHNGDIVANLFPSTMPFWLFANVMLIFLAILHVWWFYLIMRIAYKLLMGIEKASEIADDEYEGSNELKQD
jgi:hypothetical protein